MCIARSNGWLDYDEKISAYWPEYGNSGCGKGELTVAHVLRHEAGLEKFCEQIPFEDTLTQAIKRNSIGKVIEKTKMYIRPETDRAYHTITKDWILNEIFRRVEPQGRTMGEYWDQEIRDQFDIKDVYPRMSREELSKSHNQTSVSLWAQWRNTYEEENKRYIKFSFS